MTITADHDLALNPTPAPTGPARWLVTTLVAVIALALGAAGFALGAVTGGPDGSSVVPVPADTSVEVGFARDMITHHQQAIQMAGITRDRSSDPAVRLLAFDIETGQLDQVGQLRGWLEIWGKNPNNPGEPMGWMPASESHMDHGANGLMPGMATPEQMAALRAAKGQALDVLFLQLMIQHHQGGLPMAQYAVDHASQPVVRELARAMVKAQSAEVISMEQMLRDRGATPLPPPF
ncbi:MAG TPA: DUF305 domain-containing protein [Mycobacteriales bacterium]|jgi:Uncharacterized protein conserved in bacteria